MNGTAVSPTGLEGGMSYLLALLDIGGLGSKLVQDLSVYWWILLLSFTLALLLSLLWIGECLGDCRKMVYRYYCYVIEEGIIQKRRQRSSAFILFHCATSFGWLTQR